MQYSRTAVLAAAFALLAASGCTSSRFSSADSRPAPLPAAPAGTVTTQQLPPPSTPATTASEFPTAPETQVAATSTEPPVGAPDLTAGAVTGVWKASVSGQDCQIATSLTKLGPNNRAAPLRCAAPIDGVKSWNVAGKQLTLYDETGGTVARLYSSGPEKFDGQTATGLPISLSR